MARSGYYLSSVDALSIGDDIENYEFEILNTYPNPFNPSVSIDYSMNISNFVEITIVNLEGKIVQNLESSFKSQGLHSIIWNASNVSSGVYFVNISISGQTQTQKLMLLK